MQCGRPGPPPAGVLEVFQCAREPVSAPEYNQGSESSTDKGVYSSPPPYTTPLAEGRSSRNSSHASLFLYFSPFYLSLSLSLSQTLPNEQSKDSQIRTRIYEYGRPTKRLQRFVPCKYICPGISPRPCAASRISHSNQAIRLE